MVYISMYRSLHTWPNSLPLSCMGSLS